MSWQRRNNFDLTPNPTVFVSLPRCAVAESTVMPPTSEAPLMSPGNPRSPYDTKRHEYRSGPFAYRWSRTLVFISFLILNNLAWTYLYTRGGSESLARFQASKTHDDVASPIHLTPVPKSTPSVEYQAIAPRRETIQLVMVMLGTDSATEGAMTIKSALMHSSRPLAFHIICDTVAIPIIENKLQLFKRPAYSLDVMFYPITIDAIKARSARAGIGAKRAHWGTIAKVFMHELLPTVDKAIFVDTDMLFVVDPVLLWNSFSSLKSEQIIAFPTLGPNSDASRICTCVMLLNFAGMRNVRQPFMSSSLVPGWPENSLSSQAIKLTLAGDGMVPDGDRSKRVEFDPFDLLFGDQGLYHVVWTHFPELFAHLSLRWDITHCRKGYGLELGHRHDSGGEDMSETEQVKAQSWMDEAPEKFQQLLPGILHFNCQDRPVVWDFEENYEENTWSSMITMITRYKWIWLNRGDGSATIKIRVEKDVRFEDERVAEATNGT
ncbi:hypothetical protein RhiJN_28103 [Ceratobasidium sp. AG-Ba]|nr:hypothetical protein RhiJN_28103 [Ceratobasidium sp. AG-Ba]